MNRGGQEKVTTTARDARGCCCGMPCLDARVARIGAGIVRQVILDMRLRSNMNSGQASKQNKVRHGTDGSTSVLCWQDKGMRVLAQNRNCHYCDRSAGLHSHTHANDD